MRDRSACAITERRQHMKRTIVFYIATLTRGGAERVIVNLANYFCREGYLVYLVTLEPDGGLYPIEEEVRQVVLADRAGGGMIGRICNAAGRITGVRRLLKRTRAVALVSFIGKTNLRAILAGLFLPTRVFVSVRSAPAREYPAGMLRWLAKGLFCLADGIVFQSEGARDFFPKMARGKSRVMFNPLSPDYVRPLYQGERRNEIVTVGRLDQVKNHRLLLEAFFLVTTARPELGLHLTIYGGGECMEALRAQAVSLGVEAQVSLPGDCRDIAERIQDARIFVLSSDFEGMPNAVAEAFALGIPVVSTDCPSGGARMLTGRDERGLLVPVRDAQKMAEAILRILDDKELEERLRTAAYAFSLSLHPDRIHGMWKTYIEEICRDGYEWK